MEGEALAALGQVGAQGSLRYAVQMLTPARILAETYGRDKVGERASKQLWAGSVCVCVGGVDPVAHRFPVVVPFLCQVSVADVQEVDALFHDAKASAKLLAQTGSDGWLK